MFTDVARPADGAPAVELRVHARRATVTVDDDGCMTGTTFTGDDTAVAATEVTIPIGFVGVTSSLTCDPLLLTGTLLGPDGNPFPVDESSVRVEIDGAPPTTGTFDVDDDGGFRVSVKRWDPSRGAHVTLTVVSEPTRTVPTEDGCADVYALLATQTWDLDGPITAPESVPVIGVEGLLGGVCGPATGPPRPSPATTAPRITLPSTDTLDRGLANGGGGLAAALLLLMTISLAATIAADPRLSRRGG